VQWAIRSGDAVSGVSVIHMTPALDAGHVIVARSTPVGERETAAELEPRLAALGAGAVTDAIERMQAALATTGSVAEIGIPQDAARATRAPRLAKQDGLVDWSQPAAALERLRRALEPWPRLTTFFTRGDGQRQRLVLEDVEVLPASDLEPAAPGTVLDTSGGRIVVACGGGTTVAITRVVPEGRRSMTAADFLRGSPLLPGAVLG
jgi:methionyl-tRNA formyltransferase